jgi:hypothetical protein
MESEGQLQYERNVKSFLAKLNTLKEEAKGSKVFRAQTLADCIQHLFDATKNLEKRGAINSIEDIEEGIEALKEANVSVHSMLRDDIENVWFVLKNVGPLSSYDSDTWMKNIDRAADDIRHTEYLLGQFEYIEFFLLSKIGQLLRDSKKQNK